MKKKNIIWITIDGIRAYNTHRNNQNYPEVFNIMSKECIEFDKVITSAPSTVMSVSSMMTSNPAFYLSRTFYSFNLDKKKFDSLPCILKKNGYSIYGVIAYHDVRERLSDFFGNFCKKYWPKKINPFTYAWSGKEVNQIVSNILRTGIKKPFFLYVHYRKLPNVSNNALSLISQLKKSKLYQDSIFILSSDHGYFDKVQEVPDSRLRKLVISHDMYLDESSLYVPLLIKYPGSPIKKIHKQISTLDTTPTILNFLGLDISKLRFKGVSLLNLINNKESKKYDHRHFRSDNRYVFQPSRLTSIKDSRYKYLFSYDSKKEEFYDIKNDPLEQRNLINTSLFSKKLSLFRNEFKSQEKAALKFHKSYLISKFSIIVKKLNIKSIKTVYISNTGSNLFEEILKEIIHKEFPQATINNKKKKVDLAIIHLVNKTGIGYEKTFKKLKVIKPKRTIYMDYNMDLCKKPNLFKYAIDHLSDNSRFYTRTPKSFATWLIRLISKKMKGEDIHKSIK
jgi:hypothetical protein